MTQPEQAVGGATDNDTVIAAEPTIEDRFAAITEQDEEPEAPMPEAAEDLPDDAELEVDEEDAPPIQAPVSWPDEDKVAFAELPRDMQERISTREAEREKFVQAKSREAKQASDRAQIEAADTLKKINEVHIQALVSVLPQIPEKPSAHLMVSDPVAYADAVDYYEWAVGQHNAVAQTIQAIEAQQSHLDQARQQSSMQASIELLREQFPEYLEGEKASELRTSLMSTGLALGYSQEALQNVDGHDILALKQANEWKSKADKYDSLMAKRMESVRSAKALPRVSRPGAAQPKGAAAQQRYAADREAMRAGDREAEKRVFSRFI